jgi:hypothetical protein
MRLHMLFRAASFAQRYERPLREVYRAVREPRKPRHRVLRVVAGLAGIVVLAILLVVGIVLGAAMILGGVAWRLVRGPGRPVQPMARGRVLDAAYRVVSRPLLTR